MPSPFCDLITANRALIALETDITGLRRLAEGREHLLSPPLRALLVADSTADAFTDAVTARKGAVNAMARFMADFDLLLTPTAPVAAFGIDRDGPGEIAGIPVEDDAWSPCLYLANLTGQPAAAFEQVRPWNHRHPKSLCGRATHRTAWRRNEHRNGGTKLTRPEPNLRGE
jgi:aspartyl-tRNA(Asn)/glutamyl-tRNA(Gln) amidotransferase subunit A